MPQTTTNPLPASPVKTGAFSQDPRFRGENRKRKSSGWSPERRAKHAIAIRIWAPWTKSTGPKTPAGKARVSRNAVKPLKHLDPDRIVQKALRQQARYIAEINRFSDLKKNPLKNKLLKDHIRNRRKALEKQGKKAMDDLLAALVGHKVVGILANLRITGKNFPVTLRTPALYKGPMTAITLTDSLVKRIRHLQAEGNDPALKLRIIVDSGGCQGFEYKFSLVSNINSDDEVFEKDGVFVLIDDISLPFLRGAVIDYVDDLIGAYFKITNPNAKSSCGCGTSFST